MCFPAVSIACPPVLPVPSSVLNALSISLSSRLRVCWFLSTLPATSSCTLVTYTGTQNSQLGGSGSSVSVKLEFTDLIQPALTTGVLMGHILYISQSLCLQGLYYSTVSCLSVQLPSNMSTAFIFNHISLFCT